MAVFPLVGNASTHPEKVSTKTNREWYPYLPGLTSVKSISQCCPGLSPRYLIPICCPFPGFIIWHALQAWTMSRTVACCRGNRKRAVCKRVRVFFFLLDGWSDVGAYRGVDPSWWEVSSCHLGPDTIRLCPPEGWHFLESN